MVDNEEYLTVDEARRVLRTGRNKFYELVKSGRIPCFREGKKIIIPRHYLRPEVLVPTSGNSFKNTAASSSPGDEIWSQPWLGNATTKELLDELTARAEVGGYATYKTNSG